MTTSAGSERRPWSAVAVVMLFLVGVAGLIFLIPLDPNFRRDPAESIALICAFAAFAFVGALIIWQRPGNALGWIMAAVGLLAVWGALADTYADIAYDPGQRSHLLFSLALWVSLWYWFPLLGLILIFTPLLFPDGRPPSPAWRPVMWVAGLNIALITFLSAFRERVEFPGISMANPVGIPGIENPEQSRPGSVLGALFLVSLVVALASVVVRFRRSGDVERHQIKWLLFATALAVLVILSQEFIGSSLDSDIPFAITVALFPITIALAIFRYRLYEIDLLINRTLVYGVLTASLAVVYIGNVVLLQATFRALTGQESQLAVVASTLAIAALFTPIRRRVQPFIDRRFFRRKYDAAKTLQSFSARLRDETDLETLNEDLIGAVRETMQPAHVSLWLRPDPARRASEEPE